MNIGVAWWRNFLRDRIDRVITDYEVDSYCINIAGPRENNLKADMYVGTQQLVNDLVQRHSGALPIAEIQYDALLSCFR
jgi:hypothetical protein